MDFLYQSILNMVLSFFITKSIRWMINWVKKITLLSHRCSLWMFQNYVRFLAKGRVFAGSVWFAQWSIGNVGYIDLTIQMPVVGIKMNITYHIYPLCQTRWIYLHNIYCWKTLKYPFIIFDSASLFTMPLFYCNIFIAKNLVTLIW